MPLDGAAHAALQRSTTRCNAVQHAATQCNMFVQPIEVRFIEYMPFDDNKWAERKLVPYAEMLAERRHSRPTRSAPHRVHKGLRSVADAATAPWGRSALPYPLRGSQLHRVCGSE